VDPGTFLHPNPLKFPVPVYRRPRLKLNQLLSKMVIFRKDPCGFICILITYGAGNLKVICSNYNNNHFNCRVSFSSPFPASVLRRLCGYILDLSHYILWKVVSCVPIQQLSVHLNRVLSYSDSLFYFLNSLWGSLHVVLFNIVVGLLTWAHLRAVLSDPGIVPIPLIRHDFSDYHDGKG